MHAHATKEICWKKRGEYKDDVPGCLKIKLLLQFEVYVLKEFLMVIMTKKISFVMMLTKKKKNITHHNNH